MLMWRGVPNLLSFSCVALWCHYNIWYCVRRCTQSSRLPTWWRPTSQSASRTGARRGASSVAVTRTSWCPTAAWVSHGFQSISRKWRSFLGKQEKQRKNHYLALVTTRVTIATKELQSAVLNGVISVGLNVSSVSQKAGLTLTVVYEL